MQRIQKRRSRALDINSNPKVRRKSTSDPAKKQAGGRYILAIDQGTTSTRAMLFSHDGQVVAKSSLGITQHYPQNGWVEHDAIEIWEKTVSVITQALKDASAAWSDIRAIGVTNQRETVVVWDRHSGQPVAPAIVWQCRRTEERCSQLIDAGLMAEIRSRTGLEIDAYFSATKLAWILDEVPGTRAAAVEGRLMAGTIDSWLIWNLSGRKEHVTDVSNASRTMLFNIHQLRWDPWLLELLNIPANILPGVVPSSGVVATLTNNDLISETDPYFGRVRIAGIAGDQQAALFGQTCFKPGMIKNTYGTGGFILLQTGETPMESQQHLITTTAWQIEGGAVRSGGIETAETQPLTQYALEGSVFNAGSTIQWLRDELGIIEKSSDCDVLAASVPDSGDVFIVPAFTGLGAPWWDMSARAAILGLSRGSNKAHICRAALEAIALQSADVVLAMAADSRQPLRTIRVDGGVSVSDLMLQYQSDLLDVKIQRPRITETTALGAAYLAGLAVGFWRNFEELEQAWLLDKEFTSQKDSVWRSRELDRWTKAVRSVRYYGQINR